jgi:hypothetical protein
LTGGLATDWDDLAWKITGPEGGLRYFRMGLVLVVLGVIAMAAVGFTSIYKSDDVSLTYDMMAEDPDNVDAFGVPNSHALGHAKWALVGAALTMLYGLVFSWHAEARATALFSLAAILSSIGLFAGASLLSLAESIPSSSGGGVNVTIQASSPAAIVVVVTMGLATVGMLGMAYYNSVLSVYRGGGDLKNRRMARYSMMLAFLSLAGIFLLRVGIIMTALLEYSLGPDMLIEVQWYYTMSHIDHQATLGADEETKGTLSWQLTIASALLFLSFLVAMSGLVGGSARSLGGNSPKVRRAASLPAIAVVMLGIALLMMAWASTTAPVAARESWGIDDLEVTLGWGLLVAVVLSIGAMAMALGYMQGLGWAFIKDALTFKRRQESSEEVVVDEGIRQPMVEQALAEEARARGEFPPPEPEVVLEKLSLRERIFLKDAMRKEIIIGAVLIVLIILVALLWPGGPGSGNGGNGGVEKISMENLPLFSEEITEPHFLDAGDHVSFEALSTILGGDTNSTVYFVDHVSLTLVWTDEPDTGFLWTNQPDSFGASMQDMMGLDSPSRSGTNPQGGQGMVSIDWMSGNAWLAYGDTDIVDWGQETVYEGVDVDVTVTMETAGDQVTRAGRTQNDIGNSYSLTVTVSGHVYDSLAEGQ